MSRLTVKVAHLQNQGSDNLGIHLQALPDQVLPMFEAGAHIDVFLPQGITRQYSIASTPSCRDHYELCVKREPLSRGGSRFIHDQLAVNDELEISAPRNLFTLQPAQHHVLIAAGIGITPLICMATVLVEQQRSFVLHYYTRTPADVAFMQRLQTAFGPGTVKLHHSIDGRSPRHFLPADLDQPKPDTQVYLCGPEPFMSHMTEHALRHGWGRHQLHKEAFAANASTDGEAFQVQLRSSGTVFQVDATQTIAQALVSAGIEVPLSCEQGICGACLTGVIDGIPCHRDSVLSDSERLRNDQIALCCSRSTSARLVLDL